MEHKLISWDKLPDLSKDDLGLPKIDSETIVLYEGKAEKALGAFSLHPHITYFGGVLFAHWSVHYRDEDSPGQYVRYAISKDNGKTWTDTCSDSAILFPPMEEPISNPDEKDADGNRILGHRPHDKCGSGKHSHETWMNDLCGHYHLMLCSNGFAVADGRLFAIAEAAKGVNGGIGRVAREIRADGTKGGIFWLNEDVPNLKAINPKAINIDEYDNSAYDKALAEEIIYYLTDSRHMPQWDMSATGWKQRDGKTVRDWSNEFSQRHNGENCGETTYSYEASDGTYIRFWRNNQKIQHVQYSYDKGETWTNVLDTQFPDTGARTSVGNLPDGRVYAVGNPGFKRMQMCLSVSKDGYLFDENYILAMNPPLMKFRGRAKGTGFHYPHTAMTEDSLFVIYSLNKEDILISRINLESL